MGEDVPDEECEELRSQRNLMLFLVTAFVFASHHIRLSSDIGN